MNLLETSISLSVTNGEKASFLRIGFYC